MHRHNKITSIYNLDGEWISNQEAIVETFTNYYQGLFTSTNSVMNKEAMNPIQKLLTDDMNAQLLQNLWNGKYKQL